MENYHILDKKNIIIIKKGLEKCIDRLKFDDPNLNYIITNIKNLSKNLSALQNKERENNLVIIKDNIHDLYYSRIKKCFTSKLKVPNPYFLVLYDEITSEEIKKIISSEQIFIYNIVNCEKNTEESTNFYLFIKVVFQRMLDISRLDNFIINSFQTIIDSEIMNMQKQEIEKLYKELEFVSKLDYLTKVLNRKSFFEVLENERNRTIRNLYKLKRINKNTDNKNDKDNKNLKNNEIVFKEKRAKNLKPENEVQDEIIKSYTTYSCIMIDIDHFKKVNDTYGHLIGDQVLKKLGDLLKSKKIFRDNDIIGRFGGEEFIIILPGTDYNSAKIPAERLRLELKKMKFLGTDGNYFTIQISVGISEFKLNDKSNDDLISRADKALYYVKAHGRDQTAVFEEIFSKSKNTNKS